MPPTHVVEIPAIIFPRINNLSDFIPSDFVVPIKGTTASDYPSHQVIIKLPCGKEVVLQQGKESDLLLQDNALKKWTGWLTELRCQKCSIRNDCFENFSIFPPDLKFPQPKRGASCHSKTRSFFTKFSKKRFY